MESIYQSETYGKIVYQESFWTGKKNLTVNGVPANKVDRKTFVVHQNGVATNFTLKGSYLSGVKLVCGNESFQVVPNTTWYEYLLAVIPFAFDVTWANIAYSANLWPIAGGAIGGLITGAAMVGSILVMKLVKKPLYKILIGLGFIAVSLGLCWIIALLVITLRTK
jgi:hypothetical protein